MSSLDDFDPFRPNTTPSRGPLQKAHSHSSAPPQSPPTSVVTSSSSSSSSSTNIKPLPSRRRTAPSSIPDLGGLNLSKATSPTHSTSAVNVGISDSESSSAAITDEFTKLSSRRNTYDLTVSTAGSKKLLDPPNAKSPTHSNSKRNSNNTNNNNRAVLTIPENEDPFSPNPLSPLSTSSPPLVSTSPAFTPGRSGDRDPFDHDFPDFSRPPSSPYANTTTTIHTNSVSPERRPSSPPVVMLDFVEDESTTPTQQSVPATKSPSGVKLEKKRSTSKAKDDRTERHRDSASHHPKSPNSKRGSSNSKLSAVYDYVPRTSSSDHHRESSENLSVPVSSMSSYESPPHSPDVVPVEFQVSRFEGEDLFRCQKSKTKSSLGFAKQVISWRFPWNEEDHEVLLFHSLVSGKRTIKVDGVEVLSLKKLIDNGSTHDIVIPHSRDPTKKFTATVIIDTNTNDFVYNFLIQGIPFDEAQNVYLKNHATVLKNITI